MKSRAHSRRERDHLRNPSFLERYFQNKIVWLITLVILLPIFLFVAYFALLDLLQIEDSEEYNIIQDIIILVGIPSIIPFIIQEYRFYQKTLWTKPSTVHKEFSPSTISVEDIHMVLDCDGISTDDVASQESNNVRPIVSQLLVKNRNISLSVAHDFTRHYVDEENEDESSEYYIALFDDLIEHIRIDKQL